MSIAIVKVGACTAVGLDARQTGFMLRAGYPGLCESPLGNAAGEPITAALIPTLDARVIGPERLALLARDPFEEATAPVSDLATWVHVAVDEETADVAVVTRYLEEMIGQVMPKGRTSVRVEPRGEAAMAASLPAALRALDRSEVDVAVVGGVHSDQDPRAIAALESSGRLFSRENLDARIPGEAAAFVVLMREADARRQGLPALARMLGVGSGQETARPDNDEPAYRATGLSTAVREATSALVPSGRRAGWLLTDMTGEARRQQEWQSVFVRTQGVLENPVAVDMPALRIGYLGAAALPLFVAVAVTAWEHGYAPAKVALLLSGNDGGDRAALVLSEA